jgi:hypothetical protein
MSIVASLNGTACNTNSVPQQVLSQAKELEEFIDNFNLDISVTITGDIDDDTGALFDLRWKVSLEKGGSFMLDSYNEVYHYLRGYYHGKVVG